MIVHPCQVHAGLEVAPGLTLRTREQLDGGWLAWIEQGGVPLEETSGKPRLFAGSSCYQAQCEASRWLRSHGLILAPQCGRRASSEACSPARCLGGAPTA
ncbi:hypothetical protein DYH09_04055 [bacterium CPR1]|nr:hypothetical protein [bacterium CPR1]